MAWQLSIKAPRHILNNEVGNELLRHNTCIGDDPNITNGCLSSAIAGQSCLDGQIIEARVSKV